LGGKSIRRWEKREHKALGARNVKCGPKYKTANSLAAKRRGGGCGEKNGRHGEIFRSLTEHKLGTWAVSWTNIKG